MPLIKDTTIEHVYNLPLVDVIGEFVDLKKNGANYKGLSPFADEKSPSFIVSPGKNLYKCFSSGKGGTNAISFYMLHKNVDYPTAVTELAQMFNITVEYEEGEAAEKKASIVKAKSEMIGVNNVASEYFIKHLSDARELLRCSNETAELWEIGFAPDSWTGLKDYLHEAGDYLNIAVENGLIKKGETKMYDAFRNRLMFTIRDHRNKLVGFSGRTRQPVTDKNAKYINSSDSAIYNKSQLLFGLHIAKDAILKTSEATMVEGNWDVVILHEKKVPNTIAACGTALTIEQLKLLGKEMKAKRLLMMYDDDRAGIKACIKNSNLALALGFHVDVIFLPEGNDPDSYFRDDENRCWTPWGVADYIKQHRKDFILWSAERAALEKDASAKAKAIQDLCVMLSCIQDPFFRDDLINDVLEITGAKKSTLVKSVNALARDQARQNPENLIHGGVDGDNYTMPKGIDLKWRQVRDEVLKYACFSHNNIIYMRRGDDPYTFTAVSNFSIKIIQHMEDEKRPMRLVEMTNMHGRKRTFDTPTDDFVTELSFKKMYEGKGNYHWDGQGADFGRLCRKLKDEMGDGRMINILGWQSEGFFAFNNAMILDGKIKFYDENGCFEYAGDSFYVPSGNKIYQSNDNKFAQQKRAMLIQSKYTFEQVAKQIKIVHRNHAINALLFTIGTAFSDIIYRATDCYPILFLYGEPGSGKDNLINAIQSFFGEPQTPITITGKANTDKAKIRKFAQFINMIGHMTEYNNGSEDTDQMIKSFWDRVGYERGNIDSSVGTDSVPITMSLVFTGNDYPTNDALITRFIGEEMNVTEFTPENKIQYNLLKDMTIDGYSSLLANVLELRPLFEKDFRKTFKEVHAELSDTFTFINLADRMITNAAVLGACYKLCEKHLIFPFSWDEFKDNFKHVYERQSNKRSTGSIVAHWWECIIEAVKDPKEPIEEGREFVINGSLITLRYTEVFTRYLKMHYVLYKKNGMSKMVLLDKLEKSNCYVKTVNSVRYGGGSKSSGHQFDLEKAGVFSDFIAAMELARSQRRHYAASNTPVTGYNSAEGEKVVNKKELGEAEIPF